MYMYRGDDWKTFDTEDIYKAGQEFYELWNNYGRGRITVEQFIALYLEDKLDDYIRKVKADE